MFLQGYSKGTVKSPKTQVSFSGDIIHVDFAIDPFKMFGSSLVSKALVYNNKVQTTIDSVGIVRGFIRFYRLLYSFNSFLEQLMTQKKVEDYMTKHSKLITFKPNDRIYLVIRKLIEKSISGAPVVNDDGELIGIISEKDCLKVLLEMVMHEMPGGIVERYMSHQVTTLEYNKSIIDAVEMFQKTNFRRFPVVKGSKLVGLISRRDVLMAIKDVGGLT